MKRFKFNLERVLHLRRLQEMETKRELGLKIRDLNAKNDTLAECHDIQQAFNQDFNEVRRTGILDPIQFRRYGSYRTVLAQNIKKVEEERKEVLIKVDEARETVKLAVNKTKIFEKIKEITFKDYVDDFNKEMQKELSETAIERFRRSKIERGSALNVLMAIGATAFAFLLLMIGLLFALGALSPAKAKLIAHIIRYDQDYAEAYRIMGEKDPYILMMDDFRALKDTEKKYKKLLNKHHEDSFIITKQVLDRRKEVLRRIEETIKRSHTEYDSKISKNENLIKDLSSREKALAEAKKAFEENKQSKRKEAFDAAQKDIIKSFASMDPEAIVKILTEDKKLEEIKTNKRQGAVAYAASYIKKLKARKRAGVMEALEPSWAMAINNHLESSNPL